MMVRLSDLRDGHLLTPIRFLVLISVRSWVVPRAILRIEWLGKLKNPMTLLGIEPATVWLVTQRLNQVRYRVPQLYRRRIINFCGWWQLSFGYTEQISFIISPIILILLTSSKKQQPTETRAKLLQRAQPFQASCKIYELDQLLMYGIARLLDCNRTIPGRVPHH
jgi:hypothetical protein